MKDSYGAKFWTRLHEICKEKRKNRAVVAAQLGVNYSTFNGWIARKQFCRALLPRLEQVLEWKVSEREAEKLGVSLIDGPIQDSPRKQTISAVLRKINKRYASVRKSLQGYANMSNLLFEALSEETFFIYSSSTVAPREFITPKANEENAWAIELTRRSVARAVLNGCRCLYVRPSPLMTEYYRAWRYDQLMTSKEVKSGIADFEAFIIREGQREDTDYGRLTEMEATQRVRRHLLQCTVDTCPMWMPGITLAMIGWTSAEEVHTVMTISLPGRHFGGILTYPPYYQLRFRYLAFCRQLCEQALHSLQPVRSGDGTRKIDERTVLNPKVDEEHRNKAEAIAFFQELYRMLRAVPKAEVPYVHQP